MREVPIWEKITLTVEEAAAMSHIGENKLSRLMDDPKCTFVIFNGNRKLIKRKEFEKFISQNSKI